MSRRRRRSLGAWYVLRANQAWAPFPDNDPVPRASTDAPLLRTRRGVGSHHGSTPRGHRCSRSSGGASTASISTTPAITADELVDTLNALYAYVYDAPPELTRPAAALRVEAMDLSDQWVDRGCDLDDPLLARNDERWSRRTQPCATPPIAPG